MPDEPLPDPLVPAEVDLRDFPDMPLDVRRLRDSSLAANGDAEAFMLDCLLWCAAWHQVPAGSLPDDDRQLSNLAGFGIRPAGVEAWKAVRERVMRKWVRCNDGRLYHTVCAEKALQSWSSKLKFEYNRFHDRARKANKVREINKLPALPIPSFEDWNSGGRPAAFLENSGGIPRNSGLNIREGNVREGKKDKDKSKPKKQPTADAVASPGSKRTTTERLTLGQWLERIREAGERHPIPPDDPVITYAEQAGIPIDFVRLAWRRFRDDHVDGTRKRVRQADWRATFRNAVRDRWGALWVIDDNGNCKLTSNGIALQRVVDAEQDAKRRREGETADA